MEPKVFAATGDHQYTPVGDAYDGKSIFVTGSTGFLGKVFVEKIIYRCPKIDKIYVLLRDTAKASAEEKLKKMLDCPLFTKLKEERPSDLDKLIPIIGDISLPKLGIKPDDENVLLENVSMVFHFAATVKFNEPLHDAININLEGTRRLLDLCVRMKKIQLFLHVSTAFSNANRDVVDEVVYPPIIPLSDVGEIMKQDPFTPEQTKQILNGLPNTYTFTKSLAETLVAKFHEAEGIPTVIVRPSIVIACKDGPVSGWIDNWYGPTALVVMIGNGIIRAIPASGSYLIDLIPVDYVANLIAVAGARCRRANNVEVYNCCSSDANPITLNKLRNLIIEDSVNNTNNVFPLPVYFYIQWRWLLTTIIFLLETVPAYLGDCILKLFGKKQRYLKMLSKVDAVRSALDPFTSRTWMMKSCKTSALFESLSWTDRGVFACDITTVNWDEYIPLYFRGIRTYLIGKKTT